MIKRQEGIALITTLMVLTVLLIMALAFLQTVALEVKMATNFRNHAQAFWTAEAGLALVEHHLRATTDWPTLDGTAGDCGTLLPVGSTPLRGSCTYAIASTAEAAVATVQGRFITERATLKAGFVNIDLPEPPGAVSSFGLPGMVAFSGNAFTIDGNNWWAPTETSPEMQDNTACGPVTVPKFGVAVKDDEAQALIRSGLTGQQIDNITGAAPNPPWTPVGATPSIGVDGAYDVTALAGLWDKLSLTADLAYPAGTQISSGMVGSVADPKIVTIDGTGFSGAAFTLSASNGAGVLIVKNGTLRLTGASTWIGLVLLVGENARLEVQGGGDKSIYGSVMIVETASASSEIAAGGGNLKVRYSCDGLDVAKRALQKTKGQPQWWNQV